MLVMDVPPDVPPQYAPVIVAQAPQVQKSKDSSFDRTIGVCKLIDNQSNETAENGLTPSEMVDDYFAPVEDKFLGAKGTVTLLKGPEHGVLKDSGTVVYDADTGAARETGIRHYRYFAGGDYSGPDAATFLVEVGGLRVKVIYFFQVMPGVPGGTEGYDPLYDKKLCPNGPEWKISLNPDDPNAPIYTFEHPGQLTSALAGIVDANLTFADLPGESLGQAIGNTITLDLDAAGHGWFIDTTPWDNSEYVATSNPNEWVARQGSDAEGKMDLLSVLLHEYGHVLGLDHDSDTHSLMSEDLKAGSRRA